MERVIVTVRHAGDGQSVDMELPANLSVEALQSEIMFTLGWSGDLEVYANPPGRVLEPNETLAEAGVWDGTFLIFQPVGKSSRGRERHPERPSRVARPARSKQDSPVAGWHPLDLPAATEEKPPDSPPASGGFIWKQVDED